MCHRRQDVAVVSIVIALLASLAGAADGPGTTIRDGFETPQTSWRQEQTDATVRLIAHDRSDRAAHEGKTSEHFHFVAGPGSEFYYSYPLPKIPVSAELQVGLYVRCNRAGVQLLGRVILPADIDPETGQRSFVLVPGPTYENVNRWERLDLLHLRLSVERQARVIRASTKRPVSTEGAYLERLVVNLYGGAGESEVFLDDLSLGPVPPEAMAAHGGPAAPAFPRTTPAPRVEAHEGPRSSTVRLERGRLTREGYDWVPTAVYAPGADLGALRRAGFDVLADRIDADPKRWKAATQLGFLLVPDLAGRGGAPPAPEQAVAEAAAFPLRRSVAFWNLGEGLGRARGLKQREAELEQIRQLVAGLRRLPSDVSPFSTAAVAGEFYGYALPPRDLSAMGVAPLSWGGPLQPFDTYSYLTQRIWLTARANPGALLWAWIPAAPHRTARTAVWGLDEPPPWGDPQVQPEQVRMLTYLALAAGYRAIGYLGDSDLTRPPGRGRNAGSFSTGPALLNELALLNEEIDLFESIVAKGEAPYLFLKTHPADPPYIPSLGGPRGQQRVPPPKETAPHPSINAIGIRLAERKGMLLLVTDFSSGSQFQPPQMAIHNLNITAIGAPDGAQAFEISPGGMTALDRERVPGGTRITIPDFAVSSLVLITTDPTLAFQTEARLIHVRPKAVELAIEQAEETLRWVTEINQRIDDEGHPQKNAAALLSLAEKSLLDAREYRDRQDYPNAWSEARRVGRPLRILMRDHWEAALAEAHKATAKGFEDAPDPPAPRGVAGSRRDDKKTFSLLLQPGSSPACVAFNTLPAHYRYWVPWMQETRFSANLVPSGSFDRPESLKASGWTDQSYEYDGITSRVITVPDPDQPKKRILKMVVEPTDPKGLDNLPGFLDFPAAAVQSPPVSVSAGNFLRISVLVKRPIASAVGAGGIIVRDSIGGELFQFRSSDPIPKWSRIVLYRRAPADGTMTVTFGLAGYGKADTNEAYFDDFRVEVVEELPAASTPDLAGRPRSRNRSSAPSTATRPDSATRSTQ